MSWTKSSLRTQTRMYLDEVSAKEWLDSMIDTEINNAYQALVTAVMNVFEDYYITPVTFATTVNKQEYNSTDGIPTDIYKIRRVEINYKPSVSNNVPTRALPMNIDQVKNALSNASAINAVRATTNYYEYGFGANKVLGLIPVPQDASATAGKLWYIPVIANMVNDSDTPNIPYPDRYGYLITKFAAAHCLRKGQMEETVARQYLAEFGAGVQLMQEELTPKIAEESKMIIDSVGDNIDFSLP